MSGGCETPLGAMGPGKPEMCCFRGRAPVDSSLRPTLRHVCRLKGGQLMVGLGRCTPLPHAWCIYAVLGLHSTGWRSSHSPEICASAPLTGLNVGFHIRPLSLTYSRVSADPGHSRW